MRVVKHDKTLIVVCKKDKAIYVEDEGRTAYIKTLNKEKVIEALKTFPENLVNAVVKIIEET